MWRMIGICALVGLASLVTPGESAAQCGSVCVDIWAPDGSHAGFGCAVYPDSRTDCTAKISFCREDPCGSALLTDPNGAVLASVSTCQGNGKAILASVRSKPARRSGLAKLAAWPLKAVHMPGE